MSGPLTSEARGSTSELPLRPAQAVPGAFDFNWDANVASVEQGRAESVGRYDEERDSRLAYISARLAKETGQRPDAYMLQLGGEPGDGRPHIDEYHMWQDFAKLPAAQRATYGIGDNQADFDQRLKGQFQSEKQAREARIAKGGAIANLPGGLVGGFTSPVNQAMLAIPGLGEAGWASKMAYEAASQAGAQTLATPIEMVEARRQGGEETWGEAGQRIAMAAAGGAALKAAHLAGGAAIDKALEVSLPWRTAQALRIATPEGKVMPPDQLAAAHVLERQAEVDATNPYQNTYQGIGTHRENLDQAQQALQAVPTPGQNFAQMLPSAPVRPAPAAGGGQAYVLHDPISGDGPHEVRVLRDAKGNVALARGEGDQFQIVDVTPMANAGFSDERMIAQSFGQDTTGANVTRARPALTPGQDLAPYGLAQTTPPAAGIAPRPVPVAAGTGSGFLSERIVQGLRERGLTETQARGVAAGIHAESKSDPGALGPVQETTGHRALGLGQWLGPRLEAITKRYGPNPTLDQQLDFLVEELKGGHPAGAKVLAQSDPAAVLQAYLKDFMAPGAKDLPADLARGMEALGRPGEAVPGEAPPAPAPELEPPPAAPAIAEAPAAPHVEAPPADVTPAGVIGTSPAEDLARAQAAFDAGHMSADELLPIVERHEAARRAGVADQPVAPVPAPEPLTVRDQVLRDGLVPVMRQIVGTRGQSLANLPRLAEDLGVPLPHLRSALEELVQNGELLSNREELRLKAERARRAANAASGAKRKGTEKITRTAATPIDEAAVTYRRKPQPGVNRGGDNLLQFISRHGGISEDGLNDAGRALGTLGHDLKETHQKWVPGHGPLIRKTGMSIDDMGERLWEEGYFGPPEVADRPTEAQVLDAIERSIRGEKIHSFFDDGPPPAAKASDFAPPDPEKVTSNEALVQTYQTWDAVAAHVGLADRFSLAEIDHAREIMARGTDSLPPLDKPEGEASPEELAPYLLEAVNRDIPTGETELDGDLQGAAVDSEEPTYEHYAAAAAQVDAAADRGGSRPAAPEAGPGREGAAGSQGDAGDQGAAQGVERPGQAPPAPGGERLPAAESAAGRGGEPVTGATPDLTGAERDAANAAGNLGPVILDSEGLKAFDDPAGPAADKAADDAWHDIQAAAEAQKPKPEKPPAAPAVPRGAEPLSPNEIAALRDTPVEELRARDRYMEPQNTETPTLDYPKLPEGSVKIGAFGDPKEAYVQVLRRFDPHDLVSTEAAEGIRKSKTYQDYVRWYREGHEPPPVFVAESEKGDGKLYTTNRRRVLAAQEAGVDSIMGWFSPHNPETGLPLKYGDVVKPEAPAAPSLDLGEQVDPNLAARQRQELDLAAQQPLRGARKTGQAQEEVMPEGLFGGKIEPRMLAELEAKGLAVDLGDGKGLRPIEEIHAELEDEAKAIDTIASCILPGKGGAP